MGAAAVFGETWFWAAAALFWARAAFSVGGAPLALISDARRGPSDAGALLALMRWRARRGRGRARLTALGVAAGFAGLAALRGDALGLAALLALGPPLAADVAAARMIAAAAAAAAAPEPADEAALIAFVDKVEQVWRLRVAATALAALATASAAALAL